MGSKRLTKNQVQRSKKSDAKKSDAKKGGSCADVPAPTDRLTFILWKTQHAVERKLLQALAQLDLHLTHFGILRHLSLSSGLTGAEIARRHDVTPQSISSAVALLRKRGYVRAAAHPIHRGLVELELTPDGKKILAEAQALVASVEKELTSLMTKGELDTLKEVLIRVRSALRKEE